MRRQDDMDSAESHTRGYSQSGGQVLSVVPSFTFSSKGPLREGVGHDSPPGSRTGPSFFLTGAQGWRLGGDHHGPHKP